VLAYQLTGSSLWTALAVAAGYLPPLAARPVMDALAERPARRRLLVGADVANAALLASVPVAFSADVLTAPHVVLAAFAAQALFVCFDAANVNAVPYRAGRDRLTRPFFTGGSVAQLTAPVLAGVLLLLTAVPPLFTVDGVSLVVSALLIRALAAPSQAATLPPTRRPRWTADLRRRLTVLWGRRLDRLHTLVCGLHAAAGAALLGQFAPWLHQDLGVRPIRDLRLGLLLVLWALGGRFATAVLPRATTRLAASAGGLLPPAAADRLVTTGVLPRATADRLVARGAWSSALRVKGAGVSASARGTLRRAAGSFGGYRVTLVFLPVSGLCLLGCALAPHWLVAAVLLAGWGTAFMVVVLDARDAAGADLMLAFGLGWPAGALVGGVVAEAAGPRMGIGSGVLLVAAASLVAWLSPLRTAERTVPAADRASTHGA
jgi:hypothetical protein